MNDQTAWRKSSLSGAGGNECVELAYSSETAQVRDTKARHIGTLRFSATTFAEFVTDLKHER